jgi:hypothetical protein
MKKLLVLVAVLAIAGAAQAVTNGGFEDGPGGLLNNTPPGPFAGWQTWTWGDGSAAVSTDAYAGAASASFGTLVSWGWGGGGGAFQGEAVGAGQNVSLSAMVKTNISTNTDETGLDLCFFGAVPSETAQNPATIGRINLNVVTGLLIAENNYNVALANGSLGAADANGWKLAILNAITPAGTAYMKFEIADNGSVGNVLFDNVVSTPEPISMVLLGLGGLFLRRRVK